MERGLRPVLAARSKAKLEALAAKLGQDLETVVADVSDPRSVSALVEEGDVLVTTVGPFARWGTPAAAAAAHAGAHYLDSTGEPAFIREVFERYGPAAQRKGAGMLTSFGYDWVPGNLAGGLALRGAGKDAVRVDIGYFFTGKGSMSGGTQASSVGRLGRAGLRLSRWPDLQRAGRQARSLVLGGGQGQGRGFGGRLGALRPAPKLAPAARGQRLPGLVRAAGAPHAGAFRGHGAARRRHRGQEAGRALRQGLDRRPGRRRASQERLVRRGHRLRRGRARDVRGAPDRGRRLHLHRPNSRLGGRAGG